MKSSLCLGEIDRGRLERLESSTAASRSNDRIQVMEAEWAVSENIRREVLQAHFGSSQSAEDRKRAVGTSVNGDLVDREARSRRTARC
jgi:hypothetical protein